MSTCKFSIPFSKSVEDILSKAKTTIESQNGIFTGDENSGNFDVSVLGNTVKGTYAVEGNTLQIEITEKPFLVPCNMIESLLKNQLN